MEAKRKLGSYIIAAFFLNIFAIMSVGGVCILMVRDMVGNINRLERESSDVATIDTISASINDTIYRVGMSISGSDRKKLLEVVVIIDRVDTEILNFMAAQTIGESLTNPEEAALFQEIRDHLLEIRGIFWPQYEAVEDGGLAILDAAALERQAGRIRQLNNRIHDIHFATMSSVVEDSYGKMYFILLLYLISSMVGIFASVVGYIILTRNTIFPLKDLAEATRRVAEGDLSLRVVTDSRTEIGSLYDSFNIMTARLQEHERRLEEFNRDLERKVRERTSELQRSDETLRRTQSELIRMERIATLGHIATTVNHEIKTPLNSLSLNLQLLTKKIGKNEMADPAAKESMLNIATVIGREVERISELLEEFVKFARFSPPDPRSTDLNGLLSGIAAMINQNAAQSGVEIRLSLAKGLAPAMVDAKKMTQAVLNLCVNALQAMERGGILTLASESRPQGCAIRIRDTGKGIVPEDLERIFEPFFTKREGGLGFGLAIVQRIIEDHGGRIRCTSTPGQGTEFEILLPGPEDGGTRDEETRSSITNDEP